MEEKEESLTCSKIIDPYVFEGLGCTNFKYSIKLEENAELSIARTQDGATYRRNKIHLKNYNERAAEKGTNEAIENPESKAYSENTTLHDSDSHSEQQSEGNETTEQCRRSERVRRNPAKLQE
ncbi:unnamed protein product [Psylliodes chrysocephalus]|uniref:Uncharacterized protein n=1 Tax=Psylliodes chrysocephalus TaxID=3402493 RepID=A0A9P0GGU4_9CUCU|nr:unnamed protein product [Psylliodes chrysocephala]